METLPPPSPIQLRAELQAMVERDLLGPAAGPYEEVKERNVRGRYIVGLLAPKGQTFRPDEHDDLAEGGADDYQDGKADTVTPQMASMLPSSIGLTFSVDGAAEAIQITARWGQYQRARSESLLDDKGEGKLVWQRRPVEGVSDPIPLQAGALGPWYPQPDNEEVYVRGLCRRRDDAWTVTLFLVNGQKEPPRNKDEAWLFQPELRVRAPGGAPIFVKRQLPPGLDTRHPEDRAMQMLYRRTVEFAVGHSVAVHAGLAEGTWERAVAISTRVMPGYEVERMEPPAAADIPLLGQVVLDMKRLAELEQGQFGAALRPLAEAYSAWIETQAKRAALSVGLCPAESAGAG